MKNNDIKADFPFFENNKSSVYLDSASTSQKPRCVMDALTDFYNRSNANISRGEYAFSDEATRMFENARAKIAAYFGTDASSLAFTLNATDSLNIAAETLGRAATVGKNVVISPLEHNSALLPWMRICKESGAKLRFIPLSDGVPDLDGAEALIDDNTTAAVFTAASNVSGYRAPLKTVCRIFSERGVPLIIDATQAAPHEKIDASELEFEYMCASAHKIYGPMGVGVIIAGNERAKNRVRARLGGGTVEKAGVFGYDIKENFSRVEAGTQNAAGIIAFGAAIDYLSSHNISELWERERRLAEKLRAFLSDIGARLAPCGDDPMPLVSFDPVFIHPLDAAHLLSLNGICVRSGRHCAHAAHDMLGFESTLRVSLGIYNDDDDVDAFICAMKEIKGRYGNARKQ